MTSSLNVCDIVTNPNQPRKHFDEESIRELADSILSDGLQSPILVRPRDGKFEIVQGERRYRAHVLAELDTIRAEIREMSEDEAFHLAVIENIQREQLTDIEEARAFQRYIEMGYTHEAVAQKVKKSRTYVTTKLRLLKLIPEIQDLISLGRVSTGHAVQILKLESITDRLCGDLCFKGDEPDVFSYFQKHILLDLRKKSKITVADVTEMVDRLRERFLLAIIAVFNGRWSLEFHRGEKMSLTAHGYCMTYSLRIDAVEKGDIDFLLQRMLTRAEADPAGPKRWEIYRIMDDLTARLFALGTPQWPAEEIERRQRKVFDETTGKFDSDALEEILSWQTIDHVGDLSHDIPSH